jgi:hypothetical protein
MGRVRRFRLLQRSVYIEAKRQQAEVSALREFGEPNASLASGPTFTS